jgi:hypothetical protein
MALTDKRPTDSSEVADKAPTKQSSSLRVMCAEHVVGSLVDPDRKVRIPKGSDVKISGPVEKGSWLDCQMAAGLIVVVTE